MKLIPAVVRTTQTIQPAREPQGRWTDWGL